MAADADSKTSKETVLETAKRRFLLAQDAYDERRRLAKEDLEFASGDQWDPQTRADRQRKRKPCLTINRLPQSIHQVTNDQRQNRPSIKVSPVDDKADIDTAKIFQGLIRHIENSSNADTAKDTAFESTVTAGFGFFRVITDYCDPYSFDQEIKIKRVRNRFTVYLDPHFQEPDGSDANWGFAFEDIPHDDFKAQYPDSELASMDDWTSIGDTRMGWVTDDSVRVAEYFYREYKSVTIYQLSDGNVFEHDELQDIALPEGIEVVNKRKTLVPKIMWCKLNGLEVLEETEWLGKWIPIIPVLGDELDIDGKVIWSGMVRHAKDPQRMYNYWATAETETIALAPKAPYIGFAGQFEGFEDRWDSANIENYAYLEVNPKTVDGQMAPLPQRQVYEPPVQAISQARMIAADDLKSTTGIYDAALGNRSNENSGVAIQRRNVQAQTSNFHYIDNLSKSIRHLGRILVDLIPKVYDTARAVRILGEDDTEEVVKINQVFEHKGKTVKYDLGAGKYDVSVNTGPSFETKRQEAVVTMTDLTRAYPEIMQIAGDLFVKNMDIPGSPEIAERLRKSLPPGLVDDEKQQPLPPQVKAQMDQQMQMIDQLTASLKDANTKIDTKTIELESRERIEFAKIQANIEIELAKMGSQEAQILLKQEVAEIQNRLNLLNINQPIENETGSGSQGAVMPEEQPPTGGPSPGTPMGAY